ncbi:hypothetical protein HMPREF1522_0597 [Actinomyces sp. ICM54]|nr:hypothetical protein HMPREF1522_0597 [Actinomyces sp. ICM54]
MVNNHDTLDLVTDTPVDGVIGGLIGHYAGEKFRDGVNSVIDSHMDNG